MRDWFFCAMGYVWYCVYLCIVSSPKSRLGMIKQPSVSVSLVITGSNGGPCAYFQGKGFHEVVYFAQNGEKKPLFWGRNASRPMPQILGSWCWRSQTIIPCTMRHTIHAQLKYPSSRYVPMNIRCMPIPMRASIFQIPSPKTLQVMYPIWYPDSGYFWVIVVTNLD